MRSLFSKHPMLSHQDRIDSEAVHWLVELQDLETSHPQREKFIAWLNADQRHSDTYDQAARLYEDMSLLPRVDTSAEVQPTYFGHLRPRNAWVATAIAASMALILIVVPKYLPRAETSSVSAGAVNTGDKGVGEPASTIANKDYATPVAAQRTVTLPDGSVMTLGAASQVALNFTTLERRVTLKHGDGYFEVKHNPNRPFIVVADGTEIRAVGTAFGVRTGVGGVRVAVSEGRVEVRAPRNNSVEQKIVGVLIAGQETVIDTRSDVSAAPVRSLTIASSTSVSPVSWREGWLGYDDRPLVEIVDDLNRYYAAGIILTDERAGALHVTGAFRTKDIARFIDALPETTAIRVRRDASGTYFISPRGG